MIKNVVFDLGRVIYTFSPREDLIALGYDDEQADRFTARVFSSPLWLELDRGTYTYPTLVKKLSEDFPDMAEDFRRVLNDEWPDRVINIMPDSLDFFYEVKRRGFGVYILSNFPADGFAYCRARDNFIDDADGMVISAHENLIKPDPAIFKCLLDRYELVPEETLFIDDMAHNVAAAKALGLQGIEFTGLADCKRQFEEIVGCV